MKTTTRTKVSNIWNWLRGKPMTEPTAQQKAVFGENVKLDAAGNVIEDGVGALKYRVKQVIAKAEADLVALFDEHPAAAKPPAPAPAPAVPVVPVVAVAPAPEATPVPAQVVEAKPNPTSPSEPVVAVVAPGPSAPVVVVAPAPVAPVVDPKQTEKEALVAKLKALEAELATL